MKKRTGDPWITASEYGHSLHKFTINLLVRNVDLSCRFYIDVFDAVIRYQDQDFAAVLLPGLEFMLHADHTFDNHLWTKPLATSQRRGLGIELRLLGLDPDKVEELARKRGDIIITPAEDKAHGWRETILQDPDGYLWAVGIKIGPSGTVNHP